ncbi:MAG: hypothetical protein ACI9WS_003046 [Paraglaciecola psychrophila]|jgi:hypothetical protein
MCIQWPVSDWTQHDKDICKTVCRTDELLLNFLKSNIETLTYNEEEAYCCSRLIKAIGIADPMPVHLLKADDKERQWILDSLLGYKK